MWRRHRDFFLVSLVVLAYFLFLTGRGLWVPLRPEELQQLRWPFPNVYATVQRLFTAPAIPFHIAIYTLLIANVGLLYRFAANLSGSREIGAVAALLFSYHHRLGLLYTRVQSEREVVGTTLGLLALVCLQEALTRQTARRRWRFAALLALVLAFYSGEPGFWAALIGLGLVYSPMRGGGWTGTVIVFATLGSQGREAWRSWLFNARHYLDELVCSPAPIFKNSYVWTLVAVLVLSAYYAKRREIQWAVVFLLLASVYLVWQKPSGFESVYFLWAGCSVYIASVLVAGRDYLLRRIWQRPPIPAGPWQPERIFTFAAVMFVMITASIFDPFHRDDFSALLHPSPGSTGARICRAFLRPDA